MIKSEWKWQNSASHLLFTIAYAYDRKFQLNYFWVGFCTISIPSASFSKTIIWTRGELGLWVPRYRLRIKYIINFRYNVYNTDRDKPIRGLNEEL